MRKNYVLALLVAFLVPWLSARADDLNWSAIPADGSTVRMLETVQIQFENATKISISDNAEDGWITATLNDNDVQNPTVGKNGMLSMRSVTLSDGTLKINLHVGLFDVTLPTGVVASPAMLITYVIDSDAAVVHDVTVAYTPAQGSDVYALDKVKLDFTADLLETVSFGDAVSPDNYTIAVGSQVYRYGDDFSEGDDITEMVFDTPVTAPGAVSVNVAEGFYNLEFTDGVSQASPAAQWSFSLVESPWSPVVDITSAPAAGQQIEDLKSLKLNFSSEGLTGVALSDTASADGLTIKVGSKTYKYGTDFTANASDPTLMEFAAAVTTKGYVTVTLAEGFYTLIFDNDKTAPSPAKTWQFQIVGKTSIPAISPAEGDIYDGNLLNEVVLTMEDGITLGSVSTSLNKVYLYRILGDGTKEKVLQYTGKKTDAATATFTPTASSVVPETWELGRYVFEISKAAAVTMTTKDPTSGSTVQVGLGKLTWEWNLVEEPQIPAIDPEAGLITDPAKFQTITLTMPESDMIVGSVSTLTKKVQLFKVNGDGTETEVLKYNGKKDAANKQLAIFTGKTTPESWENGKYRFHITKGAMTVTQNGVKVLDQDFDYEYTLEQAAVTPEVKYTVTPADGSKIESLSDFSINFEGVGSVAFGEITQEGMTLTQGATVLKYYDGFTEDENDITKMILDAPMTAAGEVTLSVAEGFYELTMADGSILPSPAITSKFTIDNTHQGPYTTVPAQGATVKTLKEFSVTFNGASEVAFNENMNPSSFTLKMGDTSLSYTDGFIESDESITTMVLTDEIVKAGEVTIKIPAGFYDLTIGGATQASPAIEWTFNVEGDPFKAVTVSTTPADGDNVTSFKDFSVAFSGVDKVELGNTAGATVKQGDLTLNYGTGFSAGDPVTDLSLTEELTVSGDITVTLPEGFYTLSIGDKTAPSPKVEWSFFLTPVASGEPVWVPVKSLDELNTLEGKDLVLAWYYNGKFEINLAPEMQKSAPIDNGKAACKVMNNTQTVAGGGLIGFRGTDDAVPVLGEDNSFKGLVTLPEGTSILNIAKTADGYTIYNTNCAVPGYLCPMEDLNTNRNYLNTSATAWYNNISFTGDGYVSISEKTRDDKNILSATTSWSMGGPSECVFMYISQELDLGHMYLLSRASDAPEFAVTPTPANHSTIDAPQEAASGSEYGVVEVKFAFGGADEAVYDSEAAKTVSATFDGEDLAADRIVCDNANPAVVRFYLPVNKAGELAVTLPEGWYRLTAGNETVASPAYSYSLNLAEVLKVLDVEIGITPADGSQVTAIGQIALTIPEGVEYDLNPAMEEDDATPMTATINGVPTDLPIMQTLTLFRYRPEFNEAGTYSFTLAEGFYILTLADGTKGYSPAVTTTVEVNPAGGVLDLDYTAVPAPRSTVKGELSEFSIKFEGVTEVALGDAADRNGLTVSMGSKTMHYDEEFTADAMDVSVMKFNTPIEGDNTTVIVDLAEGFYVLTLEDGTMGKSPEVHYSFTLTTAVGIVAILGEDFTGDVYGIDGVCVIRDANAADLRKLAPGLYIIGGRKFMVGK